MGRSFLTGCLALVAATGAFAAAQQLPVPPPPPPAPVRDAMPLPMRGPAGPSVRTFPVGNGAISGVVTAADSGRPIRGARVTINGTVPAPPRTGGPSGAIPGATTFTTAPGMQGNITISTNTTGVSRTAITDAQGRFSFARLPAARFNLTVTRTGYLNATHGEKRPMGRGTPITLAEGQQVQAPMRLTKGGAITGVALGEFGEPLPNAQIRAWRYTTTTGVRRLQSANSSMTDDRGVYRLHSLQPGEYVVSVTPNNSDLVMERASQEMSALEGALRSGQVKPPAGPGLPATVTVTMPPPPEPRDVMPSTYLPTFHPSTPVATDGTVIRIAGGDEHANADIQAQFVRASVVQGTLAAALPSGVAVQVALIPDDPALPASNSQTRAQEDGRFTLGNITPGRYTLLAWTVPGPNRGPVTINTTQVQAFPTPMPAGAPANLTFSTGPQRLDDSQKLFARMPIVVDGQSPVMVTLSLQPGRTISGRVIFEMAQPPDLSAGRTMASLTHANTGLSIPTPMPSPAPIGPDGSFTFKGVFPGKFVLRANGMVKSSMVGMQDTLDVPLDFTGDRDVTDAVITVTDKTSELTGTLTDAAGRPAFDYSILAVTTDQRLWMAGSRRIMVAQLGLDGTYTFRNLPPGDYMVAAIADLEPGGQYDPELLRSLAGASLRVTVTEGAKATQNIRVAR
jgi:uncharacterized protein (DUF2141 family)